MDIYWIIMHCMVKPGGCNSLPAGTRARADVFIKDTGWDNAFFHSCDQLAILYWEIIDFEPGIKPKRENHINDPEFLKLFDEASEKGLSILIRPKPLGSGQN
jgi:hypothetical protein